MTAMAWTEHDTGKRRMRSLYGVWGSGQDNVVAVGVGLAFKYDGLELVVR